jgi:branched-chain amino acid transport system substrate-binding protein
MKPCALAVVFALVVSLFAMGAAPAWAAQDIVIGLQCDRTGPTQVVGTVLCPGYHDYVDLVNSKGGVDGHMIRVLEIDHEYKVPPAVEAYERFKEQGAVLVALYGTPQTYALTEKLTQDRIPGTSPGFGRADAADGIRYPYIFPIAATYWSQAAAAVQFVKQQLHDLHGKKIAYLFYDNPAGREPLPVLQDLAKREGFELKLFAVPPPGLEMSAQVLDIARRYRADFVIAHLFGRAPSVSIKELKAAGYPLDKVLSFVWGSAEADIAAAGGGDVADGYYTMQFAGVGENYPVIKQIREMYQKKGEAPPAAMKSTVYYNRGVLQAALAVQGIKNALDAKPNGTITGEDVKNGLEHIKNFTLGGLVPPIELSATNHEGGGWVQVWQVKGGKLVRTTDWFKAYPDVIAAHLKEAASKQS